MKFFAQNKFNGVILFATLISCFIAFYNKFPLVYPDTGTYISAAYDQKVPMDRPIFYSYFINYLSMDLSLWPVICVQGLLVCYLNFLTLGIFFEGLRRSIVYSILTFILVIFTGFSYNISILIPDIFSAIVILCLVNILLNRKLSRFQFVLVLLIFLFSICTQFSSISIVFPLLLMVAMFLLYGRWKKSESVISTKHFLIATAVFLSSLILIPTVNYMVSRKFVLSQSGHVFFMNRLVETGILEDYLAEACNTHHYKICQYKNGVGWDFIWSPESALQKTGGWEANREEYQAIIKDVFLHKKYVKMFIVKSIENSIKQFFAFQVTLYPPMLAGTAPFEQVEIHFKHTYREYHSSLQSNAKIDLRFVNTSQQVLVLLSMLIVFVVMLTPVLFKQLSSQLRWALILFVVHNIISAIVCANLSTVDDRYQNRLIWLYPFFACIVAVKLIEQRASKTEEKSSFLSKNDQT